MFLVLQKETIFIKITVNDAFASYKKTPSFVKRQKISVRSSYMLTDLLDNRFIRLSDALEKKGFNSMLD